MNDFSQHQSDNSYITRLTQSKRQATAAVDIYNRDGTLLLRKGQPIDERRSELLMVHKLVKPIEACVELEQQLKPIHLLRQVEQLIDSAADLQSLEKHWRTISWLSDLLHELQRHPILLQKLTLLHEQLPDLFKQTLFTTWFSCGLSLEMSYDYEQQLSLLLAALTHDLGMLHIDPNEQDHSRTLSPEQWRQVQAHPLIGARMLEHLHALPRSVASTVMQHHERYDGTGYPRALLAEQLEIDAQMLSCGDALYAMRFNQPHAPPLRELLPVLQANRGSQFHPKVCDAAMVAIRNGCPPLPVQRYPIDINQLCRNVQALQQLSALGETMVKQHDQGSQALRPRIIRQCIEQYQTILLRAGLKNKTVLTWLHSSAGSDDPGELYAQQELIVMVRELKFALRRIQREIEALVHSGDLSDETQQEFKQGLQQMQDLLQQAV